MTSSLDGGPRRSTSPSGSPEGGAIPTETRRRTQRAENSAGLRERARCVIELFAETARRFSDNDGYRLGAAFSYYATFSIFPLLLLAVTVVGYVLGDSEPARARMLDTISTPNSPVYELIDRTLTTMQEQKGARGPSAIAGAFLLLFAASGAFVELDAALNRIWEVPKRPTSGFAGSIRALVLDRLSGFAMVLGLGFTLMVSLVSSSTLAFIAARAEEQMSTPLWPALVRASELMLSMALLSLLFTLIFHLIPRSHPPIRTVARGAFLTTVGLTLLKELFVSYFSGFVSYSAYGVVGSLLGLLTWIYLSGMIILFGAQLTRVHAERLGTTATSE